MGDEKKEIVKSVVDDDVFTVHCFAKIIKIVVRVKTDAVADDDERNRVPRMVGRAKHTHTPMMHTFPLLTTCPGP